MLPYRSIVLQLASCLLVAGTMLLNASAATAAGGVTVSGGTLLQVDVNAALAADITVTGGNGTFLVTDEEALPSAGVGCVVAAEPNTVSCTTTSAHVSVASDSPTSIDLTGAVATADIQQAGASALTARCSTRLRCTVFGGSGSDLVYGGRDDDYLIGSDGDDMLVGGGGWDSVYGGDGDDSEFGGVGNDRFGCDGGDDVINGGPGVDSYSCLDENHRQVIRLDDVANDGVSGESDNVRSDVETIFAGQADDLVVGGAAANTIFGGHGDDTLVGGGGRDDIFGDEGEDTLFGGAHDDRLVGGDGDDAMSGGAGFDRVSYLGENLFQGFGDARGESAPTGSLTEVGVTVALDGRPNDGRPGERDDVRVEWVIGTDLNDVLVGNGLGNRLEGRAGSDRIRAQGGADSVVGGDGDDLLVGGAGRDEVRGGAGDDMLRVRDGREDVADCGSADDIVVADRALDVAWATCEKVFHA